MSPVTDINSKFEHFKQQLPENWRELAIQTAAFERSRQLKTPADLLRTVFAYAIADYSLREVAGVLSAERQP